MIDSFLYSGKRNSQILQREDGIELIKLRGCVASVSILLALCGREQPDPIIVKQGILADGKE